MEGALSGSASASAERHRNGNSADPSGGAGPIDWERLARSTAHPLRVSILEVLSLDGGRVLSPNELAQELQLPLGNVNYHVTELVKARLVRLVDERQVRGATEHFYGLVDRRPDNGN